MSEVTVIAKVRAKDGFEDEVYEHLSNLHEYSHNRRTNFLCYEFDFHRGLDDKDVYIFVETWKSHDRLENHLQERLLLDPLANLEDKLDVLYYIG